MDKPVLGLLRRQSVILGGKPHVAHSVFTQRYKRFRELIVAARKEAALTQLELARKLGRPQSFVSKYELGERRLDVIEFIDVATALGIKPESLLAKVRNFKEHSSRG